MYDFMFGKRADALLNHAPLLLLSILLLQGCTVMVPAESYSMGAIVEDRAFLSLYDFYSKTQQTLAELSDEKKAQMERERAAVLADFVEAAPDSCALFPEAYRAAYADGYALCAITRELFHPRLIVMDFPKTNASDNAELENTPPAPARVMFRVLGERESTPFRKAYIKGWSDGQEAAWHQIENQRKPQSSN